MYKVIDEELYIVTKDKREQKYLPKDTASIDFGVFKQLNFLQLQ